MDFLKYMPGVSDEYVKEAEDRIYKLNSKKIKMSRFRFAIRCLHNLLQIKSKENIVLCPFSLYDGLFVIYLTMDLFVDGDIERQLKNTLGLNNFTKCELFEYICKKKAQELNKYDDLLSSYNYIDDCLCWVNDDTEYLQELKKRYTFDKFEPIKFYPHPYEKIKDINTFIRDETERHIYYPVQLNEHSQYIELVLANILYFDEKQFEIQTDGQSDLQRRQRDSFFMPELSVHVSEFPYMNSDTSLFVLLPAILSDTWMIKRNITDADICELVHRLSSNRATWQLRNVLRSKPTENNGIVFYPTSEDESDLWGWPTFELEKNLEICELLKTLGLEQLFLPGAIHIGSWCWENSTHLAKFIHRAHVKVTQVDTLAGGNNMICTEHESLSSIEIDNVNCNYPFVWLIYEKQFNEIFFIGVCNKLPQFSFETMGVRRISRRGHN